MKGSCIKHKQNTTHARCPFSTLEQSGDYWMLVLLQWVGHVVGHTKSSLEVWFDLSAVVSVLEPFLPVYMQVSMRPRAAMALCGEGMFTLSTLSLTSASPSTRDNCSDRRRRSSPRRTQ